MTLYRAAFAFAGWIKKITKAQGCDKAHGAERYIILLCLLLFYPPPPLTLFLSDQTVPAVTFASDTHTFPLPTLCYRWVVYLFCVKPPLPLTPTPHPTDAFFSPSLWSFIAMVFICFTLASSIFLTLALRSFSPHPPPPPFLSSLYIRPMGDFHTKIATPPPQTHPPTPRPPPRPPYLNRRRTFCTLHFVYSFF